MRRRARSPYKRTRSATRLHLNIVPFATAREPVTLLYSDDPESVGTDGVLFRSTQPIDGKHPARLYAYHAAADPGRNVYIVVTTLGARSDVQLTGAGIGPYGDYHCVGHNATTSYLARRALHEGIRANVTPAAPLILRVNARAMPARTLVTGIYDIAVAGGDPVRVTVASAAGEANPLALLNGRPEASDGHRRRGEYDLTTVKPGPDTVTLWFDGDTGPTEIGRIPDPNVRTAIRQFTLAPGLTQDVSAIFMADGSSWFPLELRRTAGPTSPPPANAFDVCARALIDQAS